MTWQEELEQNISLFDEPKKNWSGDELALAYRIYNGYNGTYLVDTGCGSCRRSVIAHCMKIAKDSKKV
jgi:hypothetical protein